MPADKSFTIKWLGRAAVLSLLCGCYSSEAFEMLTQGGDGNSSSSSGGPADSTSPSATVSSGAATSDDSGDSSASTTEGGEVSTDSSTGDDDTAGDVGPTVTLTVDPPLLFLAGPVELDVEHSLDAIRFELWDAIDDEHPRAEWEKGESPPAYVLTQGKPGEVRSLTVRAYDSEDNVGVSEPATVELQLPESGTVLWETEFALDDITQARALTSGVLAGSVAIVPGYDANSSARISRVNAQGKPNLNAPVADPLSTTTGVAIQPDGWILAAGVDLVDGKNRGWVARVNPATADVERIFEGQLGDAVTGLAYDPELERIYLSGYAPKGDKAPDARLWSLSNAGDLLWWQAWERPVVKNVDKERPIDRGLAVAVLDNGDPAMVGETWFKEMGDMANAELWAFVLRYSPQGELSEDMVWTSADSIKLAGAYAVAPDLDNGLLVAGWSSPIEDGRQATVWAFDEYLTPAEIYPQGPSDSWTSKAVKRLQTGEIVNIVDVDVDVEDRHDFEVRALASGFVTAWTRTFSGGTETRGVALTVTPHGHIVAVGNRIDAGTSTMLLIGLHP